MKCHNQGRSPRSRHEVASGVGQIEKQEASRPESSAV